MRRTQEDAERAIQTMNGMVVGQWRVRCGWANHKQVHRLRHRRYPEPTLKISLILP